MKVKKYFVAAGVFSLCLGLGVTGVYALEPITGEGTSKKETTGTSKNGVVCSYDAGSGWAVIRGEELASDTGANFNIPTQSGCGTGGGALCAAWGKTDSVGPRTAIERIINHNAEMTLGFSTKSDKFKYADSAAKLREKLKLCMKSDYVAIKSFSTQCNGHSTQSIPGNAVGTGGPEKIRSEYPEAEAIDNSLNQQQVRNYEAATKELTIAQNDAARIVDQLTSQNSSLGTSLGQIKTWFGNVQTAAEENQKKGGRDTKVYNELYEAGSGSPDLTALRNLLANNPEGSGLVDSLEASINYAKNITNSLLKNKRRQTYPEFAKFAKQHGKPDSWLICSKDNEEEITEGVIPPPSIEPTEPSEAGGVLYKNIMFDGNIGVFKNGRDEIGEDNVHHQETGWLPTAYYDYPYTYAATGQLCANAADKAKAKNGNAVPKTLDYWHKKAVDEEPGRTYTLNTDARNQQAIAEGGVFDWSVYEKDGNWAAWLVCIKEETYPCNCTESGCSTCTRCVEWECRSSVGQSDAHLTHFWQQFAVQCNQKGYNDVVGSRPGAKHGDGGEGGRFYGWAYSQVFKGPNPTYYYGKGHQEAAESPGFFTKECPFHCTTDTGKGNAPKESGGNVSATSTTSLDGLGGAYGNNNKSENTKEIQQFRDGESIPLYINMSFPISGSGVDYSGDSAKTTTITRDLKGTPDTNPAEAGLFRLMTSPGGANLFGPKGVSTENQAGYDTAPTQKSAGIAVLDGPRNKFYISHTWASELNNPNRLNFKWEYDTQVHNEPISSVTLDGYDVRNKPRQYVDEVEQPFPQANITVTHDGKCYGSFGTDKGYDTIDLFQQNTGRGVKNNMDDKLIDDFNSWLKIRGVRATTK